MKKTILTALLALPILSACSDNSTYADAACVDTISNVRLDNSACSPNYGGPIGTHSWAYSSYGYNQQTVPVIYVGQPVPRTTYVFTRPSRINVSHISAPAPIRPPGSTSATVLQPSQSLLTDKRMASVRAANPNIVRGGLGVPGARPAAPAPNRTVNSPAPGRAPAVAPKPTAYKAPASKPTTSTSKTTRK